MREILVPQECEECGNKEILIDMCEGDRYFEPPAIQCASCGHEHTWY